MAIIISGDGNRKRSRHIYVEYVVFCLADLMTEASRKARQNLAYRRHCLKVKGDPVLYERWRQRNREKCRKYRVKKRTDPWTTWPPQQ